MDEIWIRNTFDWCVNILFNVADNIGVSYEALNVWIFLILIPVVLGVSVGTNFYLLWKSGKLERESSLVDRKLIKTNPYIKTLHG